METAPDHVVEVDGHETVEYRWLSPRDALDAYVHGDIVLAPPTLVTLEELDHDAPAGEIARSVARPLRCICPLLTDDGGTLTLALPGDVLHADAVPVFAARTRIVRGADGRFASGARAR